MASFDNSENKSMEPPVIILTGFMDKVGLSAPYFATTSAHELRKYIVKNIDMLRDEVSILTIIASDQSADCDGEQIVMARIWEYRKPVDIKEKYRKFIEFVNSRLCGFEARELKKAIKFAKKYVDTPSSINVGEKEVDISDLSLSDLMAIRSKLNCVIAMRTAQSADSNLDKEDYKDE